MRFIKFVAKKAFGDLNYNRTGRLIHKIKKAVRNPKKVVSYFLEVIEKTRRELKQKQVKRVEENGEIFYLYKGDLYPGYLNNGNAASLIKDKAEKYCIGKGIDVGASKWPLPGAIPIQNEQHQNAYKLDNFPDGSLDFVFSSHCLEHLDKWQDALKLWIQKLRINGILFLYLPHKSMRLWNPKGPWVGSNHKWIPSCEVINQFLTEHQMLVLEYNPDKDKYWSFHVVAKRIK